MRRAWDNFWGLRWRWKAPVIGLVALIVIAAVMPVEEQEDVSEGEETATAASAGGPQPVAAADTATSIPTTTSTPTATTTPVPTATPAPPPEPVVIEGFGPTATDLVQPPAPVSVATLRHSGAANFAVWLYQGDTRDLLVNVIGGYAGARPIFSDGPVQFDIDADGAWSITVEPIGRASGIAFEGTGDAVSGLFEPADSRTTIELSHSGSSNFAIWLQCAGGSDLVANEIGAVTGSTIVSLPDGPCLWDVTADGNWSILPR